jgi:oligoribonuclease
LQKSGDKSPHSKKEEVMLGIFLDTETSGLNPLKHCVLEIALKILDVETGELKGEFQSLVSQSWDEWKKGDPDSLKINQLSWEEIQRGRSPSSIGKLISDLLNAHGIKKGNAVFICQNPSFDRAFFSQLIDPDLQESFGWPYHWLDLASMHWAKSIEKGKTQPELFPWQTGVSKDKIAKACALSGEEKPHRAMKGVDHLLLCYKTVVGFPACV